MSVLRIECNLCGFATSLTDERTIVEKMKAIDAVHDLMRPDCTETKRRALERAEV